ncbi:MAG: aminodeoxychorismate/anthranilate synthase component II [Phycisphaerae bacterium]|nr:aminodeoxychorismate/anthranilate synthase component II [Phycisphaerae bacterium]
MKTVIIIDNYDSFTYNLFQAVAALKEKPRVQVLRNDMATGPDLENYNPTHLILSPGPCTPDTAGNSETIIKYWAGKIPMLGVCLGHQSIAQAYGGQVVRARRCMHGKTSMIHHDNQGLFRGIPNPFEAMRYHSLTVNIENLDSGFIASAHTETGELMGIRNPSLKIEGLQFHPESFATEQGSNLLKNFLDSE